MGLQYLMVPTTALWTISNTRQVNYYSYYKDYVLSLLQDVIHWSRLKCFVQVISLTEAFNSSEEKRESSKNLPEQESYSVSQYTPFPSKKRKTLG